MTKKALVTISQLLQFGGSTKATLAYIQGRLLEAGDAVERRASSKDTESQRKAVLVAALRAMRDEIEATIEGLKREGEKG